MARIRPTISQQTANFITSKFQYIREKAREANKPLVDKQGNTDLESFSLGEQTETVINYMIDDIGYARQDLRKVNNKYSQLVYKTEKFNDTSWLGRLWFVLSGKTI